MNKKATFTSDFFLSIESTVESKESFRRSSISCSLKWPFQGSFSTRELNDPPHLSGANCELLLLLAVASRAALKSDYRETLKSLIIEAGAGLA